MALVVDLRITAGDGLDHIGVLEVRRLTSLHHRPEDAADEVHRYVATRYASDGLNRLAEAQFEHRYGDGAWMCTLRALQALAEA